MKPEIKNYINKLENVNKLHVIIIALNTICTYDVNPLKILLSL